MEQSKITFIPLVGDSRLVESDFVSQLPQKKITFVCTGSRLLECDRKDKLYSFDLTLSTGEQIMVKRMVPVRERVFIPYNKPFSCDLIYSRWNCLNDDGWHEEIVERIDWNTMQPTKNF